MTKILITYAVEQEKIESPFSGCDVSFLRTGVGKVRSGVRLTETVLKNKPDLVLNIGTAGTLQHQVGDIFTCSRFTDRDYMGTALPGIDFRIDMEPFIASFSSLLGWGRRGICNTGDTFLTELENIEGDVVDMEGYAQAWVCERYQIPFVAVKYVTDVIGQNSVQHWEDKLADARKDLTLFFRDKSIV